jgi:cbb3-type cytochrome c oxidase subunit III
MRHLKIVSVIAVALSSPAAFADGKRTFDAKCASCHGKDGKAQTEMGQKRGARDLTDPKVQASFTDAQMIKDVTEGNGNKEHEMPAFKDKLSDDEIKAVAAYTRTLVAK